MKDTLLQILIILILAGTVGVEKTLAVVVIYIALRALTRMVFR